METDNLQDTLNVIYSSDDNYAQHMGTSIYSLLKNNQDFKKIQVFIIDNEITDANREKLQYVGAKFPNAELKFIPFGPWKSKLKLNMAWNISLSSYARLFMASMLPMDVERIVYLDCDMIICGSLKEMWTLDLKGKILGAVQDSVNEDTKKAVGLNRNEAYFNAGMLMVDLKQWREKNMEEQCLKFIEAHGGNVIHHDQGVLNGLCHQSVYILPLRYNLMTIHFIYNRRQILNYFKEQSEFYSEKEIESSKQNPAILHYTPSFTCRPWVRGCAHPKKNLYWEALAQTPWNGAEPQKNKTPWHVRLVEWKYRRFPSK